MLTSIIRRNSRSVYQSSSRPFSDSFQTKLLEILRRIQAAISAQEPVPVAVPVEQQNKKQEKIKIWEWNSIYKFTDKGEEAIGFDEAADAEKERIIEKVERVTGKKISDLGKGMTQEGREFESEKEEQKIPKSKIPENKVDEKRKNQLDF